ncbi:fimbria/pilus outer membrane usher protein [Serratia fonticola]|uniref:fimbria/pilus outer membrane usher protein n=1 Tax=Serratia fonticola TaxID=47917 RepID=UPI001AE2009D|nr:fimbria/pilus outer membrane usher protein [Serratia fonticola]MBP0996881.1 fimbrial biogenesis outer membrane usher protein [Serratia fonticola]MBP1001241.1 fimbrial biogenesis outer membrane usher protein [Serratia fonticola]MBP1011583.1 fimbrial biogenesis outer membrane usher protein [Serratia fonticola]MBP1036789.1 fimbrial biogenesis outer membrane usher protein [Serratia fonticola]CAI0721123.1 Outer membrane usher protein fimD precursor [Serratia fonticola]
MYTSSRVLSFLPHRFKRSPVSYAVLGGTLWGSLLAAPAYGEEYFDPNAIQLRDGQQSIDLVAFSTGAQIPGTYRVDILINGEPYETRDVSFFLGADGKTLVPRLTALDFKNMGVRVDAFPALAQMADTDEVKDIGALIPAASTRLDFRQLRLNISIPQASLNSRARDAVDPASWDEGMPALLLSYSASGSNSTYNGQSTQNNYLRLDSGANLGAWRLRNNSTYTGGDRGTGWENINTYLQRNIRSLNGQLVIGEGSSAGMVFDNVQFRGVQLYSDDNMLPDSLRGFAPVVRGIARSNAQVTIRQNGFVIYQSYVPPGPFAITDLYPSASSGNLDVTVKEADGSESTFVQPFSAVPIMQREGALKYAVTGGKYRTNSDRSASPNFLQSSLIYGVSNTLTVYGGTQLANNYTSLLLGTGYGLGEWGSLSLDVTQARSTLQDESTHSGQSYRLQYAKDVFQSGTTFTLAGYRYSTKGFYDFSETNEIDSSGEEGWRSTYNKRSRISLQISQSLDKWGSIAISGYQQDYWHSDSKEQTFMASYNVSHEGITYSLNSSLTKTPDGGRDQQISLGIQVPLSRWLPSAWASYNVSTGSGGRTRNDVGLSGTALENGALSYSVGQSYGNQGEGYGGQTNLGYRGRFGEVSGGYNYGPDTRQVNYGVSGGVVAHPYGVTLTQRLGDSMALVRAPGASNVDLNGNSGSGTDWRGYAVVPYITAYRKNPISLDPGTLADDVEIERTTQTVVPTNGALVLADFKTRIGGRALVSLTFRGKPVPFGAIVTVLGEGEGLTGIVGTAGEVYLSGLNDQGRLKVQWGNGSDEQCMVSYSLPPREVNGPTSVRKVTAVCQ